MSLTREGYKPLLWESFPMTNLSITLLTEFQSVCDKIIQDAGVTGLRKLCAKLLVFLDLQENDVVTSLGDGNDDVNAITAVADDNLTVIENSIKDYINIFPSKLHDGLHDNDVISKINEPDDDRLYTSYVSDNKCKESYQLRKCVLQHMNGHSYISVKEEISEIDECIVEPKSKRAYPCLQCNKEFINSLTLNKHVQRKHPIKNEDCDEAVISQNDTVIVRQNGDVGVVQTVDVTLPPDVTLGATNLSQDIGQCSLMKMPAIQPNKALLNTNGDVNVSSTDQNIVHQCPMCPKIFATVSGYSRHVNNHARRKPHTCLDCGKVFTKASHVRRHQLVHTGERPYVCSVCGETFNDTSNLKQHYFRRHTGECPHLCLQCGKKYRDNMSLVAHIRRTHKLDECPYVCMKCGKKCAMARDLRIHEVGCKGERPYACQQCFKRFSTAGNVTKHLRVHSGEKPYACSLCDKKFSQASCVREHVRIVHNRERPFQCGKCNKMYSTRSLLKRHDLSHSRERPYPCKQCNKSFSRLSILKIHESKH